MALAHFMEGLADVLKQVYCFMDDIANADLREK